MITKIVNGKIISGNEVLEDYSLYFENGKITAVTTEELPYDFVLFAEGKYVSPGFIELHSHGAGGADFMDGGTESIVTAAQLHLKHGVTGILPTSLTSSDETLKEFLSDIRKAKSLSPNILGAHLEGPHFSTEQAGAQNKTYIKDPKPSEYMPILEEFSDVIKRWDFAPELPGSEEFCKALISAGVIPAIAHSNAKLDDVERVYELGCKFITHLYSGMSTITRENGYRRLGVVESAYYFDDMAFEIIADGSHLPPELLKLILKLKDNDKICLVSDSLRATGMPEGPSYSGRRGEEIPCIIEDGVAKLPDRSAFAGSVATADCLIRTMVEKVGMPISSAVKLMTENPARIFGFKGKGKLECGFDADIVIFDDKINVSDVICSGKSA